MSALHVIVLLAVVGGFGVGYGLHAVIAAWARRGGLLDLTGVRHIEPTPGPSRVRPVLYLVPGEGVRPGERNGFYSASWLDEGSERSDA